METNGDTPGVTHDLLDVPASLESIDAKLNHIIVRLEVVHDTAERAAREAQGARVAAELSAGRSLKAKSLAQIYGSKAIKAAASMEPLPKRQRFIAIIAAAAFGGALTTFLWRLAAIGSAAAFSGCMH